MNEEGAKDWLNQRKDYNKDRLFMAISAKAPSSIITVTESLRDLFLLHFP